MRYVEKSERDALAHFASKKKKDIVLTELLSIVAVGEGELDVLETDVEFVGGVEVDGEVELALEVLLTLEGATVDGLDVLLPCEVGLGPAVVVFVG